ncbi:MAG: transporter substrate-binding domain-containing protein [Roseibium sp.]|uniref:substrate-binding periplasmic protein n=1 Tax=Roseibium sp. TaxID=1936156 RepID=UPI001B1F633E|nr:transporter substrate-binding domain-containing protein [Roseibium sp.]MBO6893262.1 transporter substrate-binding domain-containing protein [Roseibium sp.]MBO6930628.1 transporter substrate-binding domain-containing protein [Roseibium sp.]
MFNSLKVTKRFLKVCTLGAVLTTASAAAADTTIRFAHYDAYPPITFGSGQAVQGILVESIKAIFEKVDGYTPEFHGYPWARAQKLVEHGELDAFCTVATTKRQEYAVFGKEKVWGPERVAFYASDNPRAEEIKGISTMTDFGKFQIVDYLGNGWGETNLKDYSVYKVDSLADVFQLVNSNRSDIHVSPYAIGKHQLNELGLDLPVVELPFLENSSRFVIGIRKDFPGAEDLIAKLDAAISELSAENRFEQIRDKWLAS